jgi:hypothetical protein
MLRTLAVLSSHNHTGQELGCGKIFGLCPRRARTQALTDDYAIETRSIPFAVQVHEKIGTFTQNGIIRGNPRLEGITSVVWTMIELRHFGDQQLQ